MVYTNYSKDLATGESFPFVRLLFRWHGSFYKLIVHEFTIYSLVYLALNIFHTFVLTDEQETVLAEICVQLGRMSGYVVSSVTFCLGFFIQHVYKRFCYHFQVVPWPDGFAFLVSVNVRGRDMHGRLLRRTMVRYAVASIILTWMNFSERMKVLFPDLESLVVAGFLTEHEINLLKTVEKPSWRQMVAVSWCAAVVKRARTENRIEDDFALHAILSELEIIRSRCRRLFSLNNRPPPLAYFHTVIIGVYAFFSMAAIAGSHRQQTQALHKQLMSDRDPCELWALRLLSQVITMMQFSVCAGVLVISRSLLLPFGKDDNSIDVEEIVKRHLSLAYLIVDELHSFTPELKEIDNASTASRASSNQDVHLMATPHERFLSIASDEDALTKPSYIMSVAPRRDEKASTPIAQPKQIKRRESKLARLLSFRRLN